MSESTALSHKICVVSGGSSGIGRAAAEAWAAAGATVVLLARGRERLREATRAIRAAGGEAHDLAADVANPADAERVAAFLTDLAGRVDVLFNNAGIGHANQPLHELPVEVFDQVLATNLRGVYLLTRALVPLLAVRRGAQVINTTSGLKAAANWGPYSVSKSALDALTRVFAAELEPLSIRVNSFNPGWVRTALAPTAPTPVSHVVPRLMELAQYGEDGPTGEEIHA